MIRLRTLGGLDLRTADGRELRELLAQPKRAALLAYLTLATPRGPHRRDKLVALFWPELDDEHARNALSQAVRFLRRSLGDSAIAGVNGDALSLDLAGVWCDALAFEEALDAGRRVDAVELYRGELLDGVHVLNASEFERWLSTERARLAQRYAIALEELAKERESAGDDREAALWWRKAAAADAYSSRTALRLMHALVRSGDPAGAIRHARMHESLLRDELDAPPDPEIVALVRHLQAAGEEAPSDAPRPAASSGTAPKLASIGVRAISVRRRRALLAVAGVVALAAVGAAVVALRALRGDLTQAVAKEVRTAIAPIPHAAAALAARADSTDRERYLMDHYHRGRDQEISRSYTGLLAAKEAYRRMVERDSTFPLGYAGLSSAYYLIADYDYAPVRPALDSARIMALRAVALDSMRSECRTALAVALASNGDFSGSEREFTRAIQLGPLDARAHFWYSVLLVALGRGTEALREANKAAELDPLSPRGVMAMQRYARFLMSGEREERRQRVAQRRWSILKVEPGEPFAIAYDALDFADEGSCVDARSQLERAQRLVPDDNRRMLELAAMVRWSCGERTRALAMVNEMARRPDAHDHGYRIALPLARFGQKDSAFAWLARHRWTVGQLSGLSADARLDPLRSDPRYAELLRQLGLRPALRTDSEHPTAPAAERSHQPVPRSPEGSRPPDTRHDSPN